MIDIQVLVLETSTSAAKALLYDTLEGIVSVETRPYPAQVNRAGAQDTEAVYLATMAAGRAVAAGRDIAAVAVSGVWHSVAVCDAAMRPVTPTYTWAYTGASAVCQRVRSDAGLTRALYGETGCMPNVTYQPYTLRHLTENGLDVRDKQFCSQAGYNFYRMTKERRETACIVSGMGLLNTHSLEYSDLAFEFMGVDKSQWAPLTNFRETFPLGAEAAGLLGISAGVPVVPPHADGALNQLGNGATRPGFMTFSVGTSAAIRLSTPKPILSDPPATWCYVGAEGWMSGAATAGACNCVNWFKEDTLNNRWSFEELERDFGDFASQTPVFLPFLFGERCPGWRDERRGGFMELDGNTSVSSMFKAICEGVLFNVFQCYEILTALSGRPERMILSGGILNSPQWAQMAADIFGREMILSETAQTSLLGGAVLAMHAAGVLENLGDYQDRSGSAVFPRPEAHGVYREKYRRYLDFYAGCG